MLTSLMKIAGSIVLSDPAYQPYDDDNGNNVVLAFLDIEDNDTLKGLFFDDSQPNNKAVRPISQDMAEGAQVFRFDIELDKAEVNALDTTPISVTPTQLGLEAGKSFVYAGEFTFFETFDDGTPFTAGANRLRVTPDTGNPLLQYDGVQLDNAGTYREFFPSVVQNIIYDNEGLVIDATGPIGGGGANATVKIAIFYRIVNFDLFA